MSKLPSLSAHLKAFALGVVLATLALGGYSWWRSANRPAAELPVITVYKNPTCGCCVKWVDYMRQNGFTVEVEDRTDMDAVRAQHGIPAQLSSCHTAVVGDYVIEGHVPVADIRRLLDEKPQVSGLAVPGMPVGSPGMEQGDRWDPFDVLAFTRDGGFGVYASYRI